jgi:hypothetical protein
MPPEHVFGRSAQYDETHMASPFSLGIYLTYGWVDFSFKWMIGFPVLRRSMIKFILQQVVFVPRKLFEILYVILKNN